MKSVRQMFKAVNPAPFQLALVLSFSLIAAITISLAALLISATVQGYLVEALDARVARDAYLASTFYQMKLGEVAEISEQLACDPAITESLPLARTGETAALQSLDRQIVRALERPFSGNRFIAVLDPVGQLLAGRMVSTRGLVSPVPPGTNWLDLPVVRRAIREGKSFRATEIIPAQYLSGTAFAGQLHVDVLETLKAAPGLFDSREGTDGLALVGLAPVILPGGQVQGAILSFHVFNNDFALVDQIKEAARVPASTIFLGDLRVSTNVMSAEGRRAVGTRLAEDVSEIVLKQGREYVGPAFVVHENHITRYEPIRDHSGRVVGAMYVGTRESTFLNLLDDVNRRVGLIAVSMILLTLVLATIASRRITRPLKELRELVQASHRVSEGEISARAPISYGGEVGLLASSFNSMLDTLQATQDQLVQSEKLASLGQLSAGVAHELNNPLGTVLLYADILLKESRPGDERRADLQTIVRETQRCKNIVAGLLEFARQHQVAAQEIDLNAVLESIVEIELKRPAYTGVNVSVELAPTLPHIQADPAQLHQVFINLMNNAVEAMPQGGTLTLRTHPGPDSNLITVEVEDTGTGIPPENMSRLFTPFFTTKPVGKGTGLGLAIVYGIIKMHRGQINVQSQVGRGTSFTLNLPVRLPRLKTAVPAASVPGQEKSTTVIG